jgi:chorismate-pyruvate lyase
LRETLGIPGDEPVRLRHVRLACGAKVLSEATNWYVPARLTPAMNAALDSGTVPFGKVAAPLGFRRERLEARRGALPGCPRTTILSHRARLVLPDGQPLALVTECYTQENLGVVGIWLRPEREWLI